MTELTIIDPSALASVVGGEANTTTGQVGIQVPLKGGNINFGASGSTSQSNYAKCVGTVAGLPGARPADIREACGLPPSSPK